MQSPLKNAYHTLLRAVPAKTGAQIDFLCRHKALPNLSSPKTFNERVVYRKLFDRDPRFPRCADKLVAKDLVSEILGPDWVTPTIWAGPSLPPKEYRKWPIPYVLKATHGSGQNYFVTSAAREDWKAIERLATQWLKTRHGSPYAEWLYGNVAPGLIVEPYIGCGNVLPRDFKFFVFGGRVRYIQVDTDRASHHRRCFFDAAWVKQPFGLEYPLEDRPIETPTTLDRMIWAAERLGKDFEFVRIDLYEVEEHPRFGEMTFYPGSGREVFRPSEFDRVFGDLWPA